MSIVIRMKEKTPDSEVESQLLTEWELTDLWMTQDTFQHQVLQLLFLFFPSALFRRPSQRSWTFQRTWSVTSVCSSSTKALTAAWHVSLGKQLSASLLRLFVLVSPCRWKTGVNTQTHTHCKLHMQIHNQNIAIILCKFSAYVENDFVKCDVLLWKLTGYPRFPGTPSQTEPGLKPHDAAVRFLHVHHSVVASDCLSHSDFSRRWSGDKFLEGVSWHLWH